MESSETPEDPKTEDKAPSSPSVARSSINTRRTRKLQVEAEQAILEAPSKDQASGSVGPDDLSENESVSSGVREEVESVDSSGSASANTRASRGGKKQRDLRVRVQAKGKGKFAKGKGTTLTANNATSTKGKSRRSIFKRSATKAPTSVARAVTSDRVLYRGQYFTKGDIVSVTDVDGGVYFAQLRGFLTDQYCEKSCVITWLLPTANSPKPDEGFDPATYIIGPEEELPRKLEFFTFVMHAPDNYFYYRNAPYPTKSLSVDQEYVLTRMGPKIRVVTDGKESYRNA